MKASCMATGDCNSAYKLVTQAAVAAQNVSTNVKYAINAPSRSAAPGRSVFLISAQAPYRARKTLEKSCIVISRTVRTQGLYFLVAVLILKRAEQ